MEIDERRLQLHSEVQKTVYCQLAPHYVPLLFMTLFTSRRLLKDRYQDRPPHAV